MELQALGLNVTRYFGPDDVFASVVVSGTRLAITDAGEHIEYDSSDIGFGFKVLLGKEWHLTPWLGLGLAGELFLSVNRAGGETLRTLGAGLVFSVPAARRDGGAAPPRRVASRSGRRRDSRDNPENARPPVSGASEVLQNEEKAGKVQDVRHGRPPEHFLKVGSAPPRIMPRNPNMARARLCLPIQESSTVLEHLDALPVALIETDEEGTLRTWAGAAERMFGWTAAEVLGSHIDGLDLVHEADIAFVDAVVDRLRAGHDRHLVHRNRVRTRSGDVRHCEFTRIALGGMSGRHPAILSYVVDVTGQVEAETTALTARADLERWLRANPEGCCGLDWSGASRTGTRPRSGCWSAPAPRCWGGRSGRFSPSCAGPRSTTRSTRRWPMATSACSRIAPPGAGSGTRSPPFPRPAG